MNASSVFAETSTYVRVVPGGPVHGRIRPPGSKSLTNRAVLIAALAEGTSRLTGALVSEDTEVMIHSLRQLGVKIELADWGTTLTVTGLGNERRPIDSPEIECFIANSGTTIRFLTAALSALGGNYALVGVPRMHERPIGDLVDAIAPIIDGSIEAQSPGGCPPVRIASAGWKANTIEVAGGVSSQFLSGLMMAAPASSGPVHVRVVGELVSKPYVAMTAETMRAFGGCVRCDWKEDGSGDEFSILPGYTATQYAIEPDASAASYFWGAAAITGGRVTVEGLTASALQGDVGLVNVLEMMGCEVERGDDSLTVVGKPLRGVDVNMNAISDTVQTLAVVALFAQGPTRVRGVGHNRFKETDRIGDLACELRRLGASIDEHEDGLTIHPLTDLGEHFVRLRTYSDHRMAMSLSLAGLKRSNVEIEDPACTRKTYPGYWADLENLTGRPHVWG